MTVSIHTPTKGVTALSNFIFYLCTMFQSTHPRRVWQARDKAAAAAKEFQSTHPRRVWLLVNLIPIRLMRCFNPHTHEGCDFLLSCLRYAKVGFNPHTHEGCDSRIQKSPQIAICFNPHTHEGCDCQSRFFLASSELFQSTHPRRVWLCMPRLSNSGIGFNPHTHEGCDTSFRFLPPNKMVSIHTPTKGVT